jgi:hypothetical protein
MNTRALNNQTVSMVFFKVLMIEGLVCFFFYFLVSFVEFSTRLDVKSVSDVAYYSMLLFLALFAMRSLADEIRTSIFRESNAFPNRYMSKDLRPKLYKVARFSSLVWYVAVVFLIMSISSLLLKVCLFICLVSAMAYAYTYLWLPNVFGFTQSGRVDLMEKTLAILSILVVYLATMAYAISIVIQYHPF